MFYHCISSLFKKNRLLYLSFAALFGCAFAYFSSILIAIMMMIILVFGSKRSSFLFLLVFLIFYFKTLNTLPIMYYQLPQQGFARYKITKIAEVPDAIKNQYQASGTLISFSGDDELKNIPFTMKFFKKNQFETGAIYSGEIFITYQRLGKISVSTKKLQQIMIKPPSYFDILQKSSKIWLEKWLSKYTIDPHQKGLYLGLFTGETKDFFIEHFFQKLGLKHLLAISGFHFGIVAFFLLFFFRRVLPKELALSITAIACIFYYLFIGVSPSVFRALMATLFALTGKVLKGNMKPLAIIGLTLIIELFFKPHNLFSLSFQLSYLATFGIILQFQPLRSFFSKKLKKLPDKLNAYLSSLVSLNLASSTLTLPVIFYHFSSFPLLSFVYNIFIPQIISIIMIGLICALLISWAPLACKLFFWSINSVSAIALHMLYYYPRKLELIGYFPYMTLSFCILSLFFLIVVSMFLLEKTQEQDKIYALIV